MVDSAALLLPGDAFDTHSSQIIGRRVAGRSTALGFASQLRPTEDLKVVTFSNDERNLLDSLIKPSLKPGCDISYHSLDTSFLSSVGCLHLPDPGLSRWHILRSGLPANSFSLTGVIHTFLA